MGLGDDGTVLYVFIKNPGGVLHSPVRSARMGAEDVPRPWGGELLRRREKKEGMNVKKFICACLTLAMTAAVLTGCAGSGVGTSASETTQAQTETAAQPTATTQPVQTETAVTTQPEENRNALAYPAFREALATVHDKLYWPEMDGGQIELFEGGSIEDEKFADYDVDGDGEDELLISVENTYTAGMCQIVYGYDAETGGVRVEATMYPGVTYYPGIAKEMAAHNQGYAGDKLWPYAIYRYDAQADEYKWSCGADGWDKTLSDYDYSREMAFPDDIDTLGEGYVYIVSDSAGDKKFMNRTDYEAWESGVFGNVQPLDIPWQKMTAQNIALG